ncbi:dihydrofolate reductase [Kordia algicida OT-1]|uniref:dihydrofolate reductase n=1 Tax=Kordia algicida OT-1 TaxID=391587 RepID=A9DJM5_9FLAO|nr:dihydrofolate reductase [Kordia algicida]EDP98137.1 dihydrofolate reductase type I; trimethoprim resistance [Kordia algicida OT-1]
MFGKKKKPTTQIDQEQLALIENAQKRIKQKKRLYYHLIIFIIGSALLVLLNVVLGFGKDITLFQTKWFVWAILLWLFIFLFHVFDVFITNRFMGKAWEAKQLEKLVAKQEYRIEKLKQKFLEQETKVAQEQAMAEIANEPVPEVIDRSSLVIIVAAAENNVIGKDNQLIWHLSDDLKRFKKLTSGHHIIMGRKTFESFPKPLPNRTHIVITRQKDYKAPKGVIVVHTMKEAVSVATLSDAEPYVIGGGEIYKQALPFATKIELTRVHHEFEGDAYFPEIDKKDWKETNNVFHTKDDKHEYEFSFLTYERV